MPTLSTIPGPEPGRILPRRRTWLRRAGLPLLVLLLLGLVLFFYHRHRIQQRLRDALAELDREDPGWRLEELEAARATVPRALNAALPVESASKALPSLWKGVQNEEAMRLLPANVQLPEAQVRLLAEELERQTRALDATRSLPELETGRFPIRYSLDGLGTLSPHRDWMHPVARLLSLDAWHRAHRNDLAGGLRSCRGAILAGLSAGDEPIDATQLLRFACVTVGIRAAERVLGQGEPPDVELARLQSLLAKENRVNTLEIMIRGERAILHAFLHHLETDERALEGLFDLMDKLGVRKRTWKDRYLMPLERDRIRALHPRIFPVFRRQLEIARLSLSERGEGQKELETEILELKKLSPILAFLLNLDPLEESERRYHALLHSAIVALAAERYRQKHDSWPASVDALRGLAAADALLDPCDGKPLRLLRFKDGLLIYSVGVDGVDDGGKVERTGSGPPPDVGVRLWDVKRRGLPAPVALPGPPPDPWPGPEGGPPGLPGKE